MTNIRLSEVTLQNFLLLPTFPIPNTFRGPQISTKYHSVQSVPLSPLLSAMPLCDYLTFSKHFLTQLGNVPIFTIYGDNIAMLKTKNNPDTYHLYSYTTTYLRQHMHTYKDPER